MKQTTSDWFGSLTSRERKDLVSLLFGLTGHLKGHPWRRLFETFLRVLDDEYHALKHL